MRVEWFRSRHLEPGEVHGAGKGGTIKAMTERVSPRIFRVVALPAPPELARFLFIVNAV
jgi:hypothetical protein